MRNERRRWRAVDGGQWAWQLLAHQMFEEEPNAAPLIVVSAFAICEGLTRMKIQPISLSACLFLLFTTASGIGQGDLTAYYTRLHSGQDWETRSRTGVENSEFDLQFFKV